MKSIIEFLYDKNYLNLDSYIIEALSKELEKEKNRLRHRFKGKSTLEFWKYLANEKTDELTKRFDFYIKQAKDYYESTKKHMSFEKCLAEAEWLCGEEIFKSRKDYIKFLNGFEKESDKKSYFLSSNVLNTLNTSRESGINALENIINGFIQNDICFIEEITDTWCVHFLFEGKEYRNGFVATRPNGIDEYVSIIQNGFKFGTPYPEKEEFTLDELEQLYASLNKEKEENGINFAYELDYAKYNFKDIEDISGKVIMKTRYGFLGLVFKTEGIVVYHSQDDEYQVMFNGNSVKEITPIIANYDENIWGIIKNISREEDELTYEFEKKFDSWEELTDYFKSNKNKHLENYISDNFTYQKETKLDKKEKQNKLLDIVKEKFPDAYTEKNDHDYVYIENSECDIKIRFYLYDDGELAAYKVNKIGTTSIGENENHEKLLKKVERMINKMIEKKKEGK